ncbi:MAG TPA: hypothetical protein VLD16_02165 [Gaiellaceae bacterium]|nr:hypothetical protein [Gaiellaceae bacterium]
MRVLAGIAGVALIFLMLSEFFVSFMLPRRVKRDPRIARGLNRLLWRPWRAVARRFQPATADTLLGFFGPLALIVQLLVWAIGLVIGYGLLEWAVAGGSFNDRFLSSSGLFLSAGSSGGSTGLRIVQLLEGATGVGVLFIVIGYMPSVYSAFSRRETAVSQLATRGGSPPAAGTLLHRAAGRERWSELERDLQSWEAWAAELMETHLSYPLLGFYRSQHVGQNWLAALTAMVDVAAFVKATAPDADVDGADITYRIGRHALADLAHQFSLAPEPVDRLSDAEFDDLFAILERSTVANVDRETARRHLDHLRAEYEPNAQALAAYLALELPPWFRGGDIAKKPRPALGRDLVGR